MEDDIPISPPLIPTTSVDDMKLLRPRSAQDLQNSSNDMRLLYRGWRTGASHGADFDRPPSFESELSQLDADGEHSFEERAASTYSIRENSIPIDISRPITSNSSIVPTSTKEEDEEDYESATFTIGSPMEYCSNKDRHSQFLSKIVNQPAVSFSSSFDTQKKPSVLHSSMSLRKKSVSYTGLSEMEKLGLNFFPKSPVSIPRGMKDSVMSDMCRSVVKLMVGDVYVVSSLGGGHKVLNHLYNPLLSVVQAHFKKLPARYALSVNPDDVPKHMRLLAQQQRFCHTVGLHVQQLEEIQEADVFSILIVVADQDNLLDAITRSLTRMQGKILDADVMTTTTGVVLDRFTVKGDFKSEARQALLKQHIESALLKKKEELPAPTFSERLGVDKMIDSHDLSSEWKISLQDITLQHAVGSGRSGQTYAAVWRSATVAAKVINLTGPNRELGEEILSEFYREVVLVCRLRHPNVVLFLGAAIQPPTYCLVFEYMHHGTLTDLIRSSSTRSSTSSLVDFFRIGTEIALGMNYLHLCSIIHRDLKSGNILLDRHGTAKVSDFGLSCVFECGAGSELTAETGTYRWMAPEVIRHEPYSNKADVYSFAIVLWEMVAKEQPFKGMSPIQAAFAVARQQMRPTIPPETPSKLGELIKHCWCQDAEQRPSFEDILEVLPLVKASLRRREFSQLGFTP